jgi:Ca2+-binding EF-hand superfamily protein
VYSLYSNEEIENFRCIFEMFDKEKSGFIDVSDLQTIMRSLGRDP